MVAGTVPKEYQDQMLWNMACAEREWWDFASYDSRLPEKLRIFIVRMPRDEARIFEIEREVLKLNSEVQYICAQLGMEVNLAPVEVLTESRASEEYSSPDKIQVEDISVPADLMELWSNSINI
jgi:hypothetical protein